MIQSIAAFSRLKKLEVIDVCTGAKLGKPSDCEVDLSLGRITAFFVPRKKIPICFLHGPKYERRIAWHEIERIGDDTILVRVGPEI